MPLRKGLFGDWERVGRWFNEKETTYDNWGLAPMLECAEFYIDTLKKSIKGQTFDWTPLSSAYLSKKMASGYGSNILINTGSYVDGLKVTAVKKSSKTYSVFAGASPDDIHTPSGLPMGYLGAIHEYGTRDGRIPARPHHRPTWERCRAQCRNIWLRTFRESWRVK